MQRNGLTAAGADHIFEDARPSGWQAGLADALPHFRGGDRLTVWRLDRLGRTMWGWSSSPRAAAARPRVPLANRGHRYDDAGGPVLFPHSWSARSKWSTNWSLANPCRPRRSSRRRKEQETEA